LQVIIQNQKKRVYRQPKTGFTVLKKARVTRFFGFGENRVGNPTGLQAAKNRFFGFENLLN